MAGVSVTDNIAKYCSLIALIEDENIDAVLLQAPIGVFHSKKLAKVLGFSEEEAMVLKDAEESYFTQVMQSIELHDKPVYMVTPFPHIGITDIKTYDVGGSKRIPLFPNPQRASRVLRHLCWYRRYISSVSGKTSPFI